MTQEFTLFFTDRVEKQTVRPVGDEAARRGFAVRYSDKLDEETDIGVYCSHVSIMPRARISVIMLHDMAQRHDVWPAFWDTESWADYTIGILPGPSWGERWHRQANRPGARPREGVFQLGWPKADQVFASKKTFATEARALRARLGLKQAPTVLYAPSWENDGKQDDVFRSLKDLPINLVLKQAPWSDSYPQIQANIRAMNDLHRGRADNVHIVDPDEDIMPCLALSDVLVSDESSVLVEALLFGVIPIAVMDWIIPSPPPRFSVVPFDFVTKTTKAALKKTVQEVLTSPAKYSRALAQARAVHFSNLGNSARDIVSLIVSVAEGQTPAQRPLTPPPMPREELLRQSSEFELLKSRVFDLEMKLARDQAALASAARELEKIRTSRIWRYTAPLRNLRRKK